MKMKKLIAKFLIVVTLLTGTGIFAQAKTAENANADSISNRFRVSAYKTRTHRYYLYAGDTVEIELAGDGDTDLDLYIYDSKGNLIDKRVSRADYEFSSIGVHRDAYFTVKIVNRGDVYNDYDLSLAAY